jgi:hyperosmotically inducible protein
MNRKSQTIEENIKDKLDSKMGESARDIKIYIRDGDVEVSGCVNTLHEKNQAESIAAKTNAVNKIQNTIAIATNGSVSDKESETDVNSKLRNSIYANDLIGVTAKVSGGSAILKGEVYTELDRKKAIEEATKGQGIRATVNHIEITSKDGDINIANEINRRYVISSIDVQDVSSIVDSGSVRLQGFVNNHSEINSLVEIAEEVPGVSRIENKLEIRDWNLN